MLDRAGTVRTESALVSPESLGPDPHGAGAGRQSGDIAFRVMPQGKGAGVRVPSGLGRWLLELDAAARREGDRLQAAEREQGRLRIWSSRRSCRRVVRRALAGM